MVKQKQKYAAKATLLLVSNIFLSFPRTVVDDVHNIIQNYVFIIIDAMLSLHNIGAVCWTLIQMPVYLLEVAKWWSGKAILTGFSSESCNNSWIFRNSLAYVPGIGQNAVLLFNHETRHERILEVANISYNTVLCFFMEKYILITFRI